VSEERVFKLILKRAMHALVSLWIIGIMLLLFGVVTGRSDAYMATVCASTFGVTIFLGGPLLLIALWRGDLD
jgi:hypothetical protein